MTTDPSVTGASPTPPPAAVAAAPVDYAAPTALETNADAKLWGMLVHLGALAGMIGIPFGHILGPLIFWLIKKNEFPFVDEQGKESLNFQITATIALIACIPLMFVIIGIPLMFVVGIADLVYVIIAAVKTNKGEHFRYPFTLRLLK